MEKRSKSPPNLDQYLTEKKHRFITYEEGAREYGLPYWGFVRAAKEAKSNVIMRRHAMVDKDVFEKYVEEKCLFVDERKEKKKMGVKRRQIEGLEEMVHQGKKKYVRYAEGAELYSIGYHTFENLAKEAKATRKVKGVVLCNTEKIDEFIESCAEEL